MFTSLPNERGRARRAAVAVGYSEKTASVTASKLLALPKIQERIKQLELAKLHGTPALPPGARPATGVHPSTTGPWPFSQPGANHEPVTPEPPARPDVFGDEPTTDPAVFLERAMNNPKLDEKLRVDAAKALLPFKHAKLGETGKKDQQKKNAKEVASKFTPRSGPPLRAVN